MTKAKIVQRLLDEKHITAEEAVILLSETHHYTYPAVKNPLDPPHEITCKNKEERQSICLGSLMDR